MNAGTRAPGSGGERRAALLAMGLLCAFFTWRFFTWDFVVDDAFISFRYAAHLAEGSGLVYNPGERVEGYSNLLWVLLTAGGVRAGLPPDVFAVGMGWVLGLATLLAVYAGCRRTLGLGVAAAVGAAALVATSVSWTFWAASGMESVLFALLVLLLWLGIWSPLAARPAGPALLSAGAGLLALTRPEGVLAVVAVPLALAWWRRLRLRRVLLGALPGVAIVGLLFAWRLGYYGVLLPNPYYAKVGPTLASLGRGVRYLGGYLAAEGPLYLLPLWLLAPRKDRRFSSLLAALALYAAFVVYAGGDGLYRWRFAAHVVPLLGVALGLGLERLWEEHRRWLPALAVWALLVLAVPWLDGAFFVGAPVEAFRQGERRWEEMGEVLRQRSPPGLYLATNVAGKLPYYSRRRTLDLLGLTDRVIARAEVSAVGSGYAGHERADPAYVLAQRPDLIHLSLLEVAQPAPRVDLGALRARLRGSALYRYEPLLADPVFASLYRPAFLRLGPGRFARVFVRADGLAREMDPEVLRVAEWGTAASP